MTVTTALLAAVLVLLLTPSTYAAYRVQKTYNSIGCPTLMILAMNAVYYPTGQAGACVAVPCTTKGVYSYEVTCQTDAPGTWAWSLVLVNYAGPTGCTGTIASMDAFRPGWDCQYFPPASVSMVPTGGYIRLICGVTPLSSSSWVVNYMVSVSDSPVCLTAGPGSVSGIVQGCRTTAGVAGGVNAPFCYYVSTTNGAMRAGFSSVLLLLALLVSVMVLGKF